MQQRTLSDEDVEAIVTRLKEEVYRDFKVEVANGIIGYVKKAFILLLILLAIEGISGDRRFLEAISHQRGAP